jgi:hypothetical protein
LIFCQPQYYRISTPAIAALQDTQDEFQLAGRSEAFAGAFFMPQFHQDFNQTHQAWK